MKKTNSILLIALLCGCTIGEPERHNDFMSQADCFVYKYEVEDESLGNYRVEYIDTSEASGCVKTFLLDTYLLYDDKSYIVVSPNHPKYYLKEIEKYKSEYKTDTTRLSGFSLEDDKQLALTVSKEYYNSGKKSTEYHDWEYIILSKDRNGWKIDSSCKIKMWPWSNELNH
jgi:hypothetical protein